jgi:amidophosphoribosyltransferase
MLASAYACMPQPLPDNKVTMSHLPEHFTEPDEASIVLINEMDKPGEECGVVGIVRSSEDSSIAQMVAAGLQTLQHRGQESAGVAVWRDGEVPMIIKDLGLVTEVLGGNNLHGLPAGQLAIGHVRYGTVAVTDDEQKFAAAQPTEETAEDGHKVLLAHNGDFVNVDDVCNLFGVNPTEQITDSYAITACIAVERANTKTLAQAVVNVLKHVEGAFSLTIMSEGQLIAVRDPHGFRPLMLGTYPDNDGYAFASESHTLESMGAEYRREVARGEMIVCDQEGYLESTFPFDKKPSRLCAFEYVYFSAPHGRIEGRSVHMTRKNMGEQLAREQPVEADVIIGVPDSGIPASEGFSQVSNIPRVTALIKNRYLSKRTFITPGQEARTQAVKKKFDVIGPEVYGRRVVLVDDSIVHGTTMQNLVKAMRNSGATEVHLRLSSAPYKWPCFYGMNTGDPLKLIANTNPTNDELRAYFNADSVGYLSVAGLRMAAADAAGKLCTACMDGNYPTEIPVGFKP